MQSVSPCFSHKTDTLTNFVIHIFTNPNVKSHSLSLRGHFEPDFVPAELLNLWWPSFFSFFFFLIGCDVSLFQENCRFFQFFFLSFFFLLFKLSCDHWRILWANTAMAKNGKGGYKSYIYEHRKRSDHCAQNYLVKNNSKCLTYIN